MSATDYFTLADGIAKTIAKVAKPLTDAQFVALAGALGVYVEKAIAETRQAGRLSGLDEAAKVCVRFGRYMRNGAGEEEPGDRFHQAARAIRALADNASPAGHTLKGTTP